MANDRKSKEIEVEGVVNYLNRAFTKAAMKSAKTIGAKASRFLNNNGQWETTTMYDYQVEFFYLIDNIQRGPSYIAPKYIQDANQLIAQLEAESNNS